MIKRRRAQSVIELVVGIMVLIPIVLTIFDLCVIVIACQLNDSTARDACRAAASGAPVYTTNGYTPVLSDLQTAAKNRAQAVVTRTNIKSNGIVSNYSLVNCNLTLGASYSLPQPVNGYNPGGLVIGSVTVQTQVQVTPFLVKYAYAGQTMFFQSIQTYPISYSLPAM